MREHHICPKCRHNRILFVAKVPDRNDNSVEHARIAVTVLKGVGWFGGDRPGLEGVLQACVCRRCGFTEFYTHSPESISIDGTFVSELVGPEPEAPYR